METPTPVYTVPGAAQAAHKRPVQPPTAVESPTVTPYVALAARKREKSWGTCDLFSELARRAHFHPTLASVVLGTSLRRRNERLGHFSQRLRESSWAYNITEACA
jgi:hypothetical protein